MNSQPLRLEYVDPATLLSGAHPSNWRTHGEDQRAAFEGLLAEVGWTDALLYNEETNHLLDGHMRAKQALDHRLPAIPVLIGAWHGAVEAKILATRDTLGLMAGIDSKAWDSLLRDVDTGCTELMGLFSDLSAEWGTIPSDGPDATVGDDQVEAIEPESSDGESEADDRDNIAPDVVFPTDDEWGIPRLDPRMQADGPQFPVTVWRTQGKRHPMHGTWTFYADDLKFDGLWRNPGAILESKPSYVVEPNFSTHPQFPPAKVLWDTYRKRWLARWWQTKGLRVFVDLTVCPEFQAINFRGVPRGWKAYAVRTHRDSRDIQADFVAACEHAGTDDLVFLVYSGGASIKTLCNERGWFWVPDQCNVAREAAKARKGSTDGSRSK